MLKKTVKKKHNQDNFTKLRELAGDQISYTHDYPFSTLDPDWDIIAQAASTLKMWGTHPQITHIKSHQENVTMEDNLDFPVQLNVAAD